MDSTSSFSLIGHNILITGASSGIGRAAAFAVAQQGAKCALVGRNITRLNNVLQSLHGHGHIALPLDLLNEEACKSAVEQTVEALGPISGFVYCAGIEKTLPFRTTALSDLREIMAINLEAYWEITQEVLKRNNYDKSHLSIVSISSVAANGAIGKTAYSASKGAIISLTKSLAGEFASKKIRFNCICPGYVETPMLSAVQKLYKSEEAFNSSIVQKHPLGIGQPEDVANAVVYLISDASKWITGTVMTVDGGYGVRG